MGNSAVGCWNEHQSLQRQNLVSNFLSFLFFFTFFCHISLAHFFLSDTIITIIKREFSHEKYTSTARFDRNTESRDMQTCFAVRSRDIHLCSTSSGDNVMTYSFRARIREVRYIVIDNARLNLFLNF